MLPDNLDDSVNISGEEDEEDNAPTRKSKNKDGSGCNTKLTR